MPHTRLQLVLDLQRATHAVGLSLEALLADVGLSQGEAHVLALLGDGTPRSVGELQRGLNHRPSTLTGILDRLEDRGLIRRTLNAADRRSLLVALTDAGRDVEADVERAVTMIERPILNRLAPGDLAAFRAVVEAVTEEAPRSRSRTR